MSKDKNELKEELMVYDALFSRINKNLRPLEDLWRKENSPDEFVIPDMKNMITWACNKIKSIQK